MFKKIILCLLVSVPLAAFSQQNQDVMIAVSADIVEISGSIQKTTGFGWNQMLDFGEKNIPGILTLGDFERRTQLSTSLKLLETEGKAQLLSNPKIVVKNSMQANFTVGGEIPIPYSNNQGIGAEFKKFGVILQVLPTVVPNKKDTVDVQIALEVSNPDYSKPVVVQNTTIPSMITRQIQTEVEIKSGETLVIGGLKKSTRNVSMNRVPFLGSIPIIGALFRSKDVVEDQSSLFLFVTFEIIK
ncbi:MAG TPA: type II and III secretion system protein [Elusimicrobiales bacterium]|nr:type II and III secretion system protein [Elusimicrobiales bacterium]HPO95113.1 type II and III secretion system protein [Elusimicrobiales bacterium]